MQHEASVPTGWVAAEYGGNFRRLLVARRADIWRSQLQSVSLVSLLAARAHVWRRVKRAKPPAGSEGHGSSLLHGTRAHAYYFFSVASLLLSNRNLKVVIAVPGHSVSVRSSHAFLDPRLKYGEGFQNFFFRPRCLETSQALLFGTDKV